MPLTGDADLERHGDSERITDEDLAVSLKFLKRKYWRETQLIDSRYIVDIFPLLLSHADRVRENAHWIALVEKLNSPKLQCAAILHDYAKLNWRYKPYGINYFSHANEARLVVKDFLGDILNKSLSLANEISLMIMRHSYTPFVFDKIAKVEQPETRDEWALWAANILDSLDPRGIVLNLELRYLPNTDFYAADKGLLSKAFESVLATRHRSYEMIFKTPDCPASAKKIAVVYERLGAKFIKQAVAAKLATIDDFRGFCKEFFKE